MSAVERTRERRSRLVVVGDPPAAAVDSEAILQRIVFVPDLFEAVGQVARSSARTPIEAIIIDADFLQRPARRAVEAIRTIDPTVLVFMLVDHEEDPAISDASDAGLDGLLYRPLTTDLLQALLDDGIDLQEAAIPGSGNGVNSIDADYRTVEPERATEPAAEDPAIASPTPLQRVSKLPAQQSTTGPASVSTDLKDGAVLGDVDLIEAILSDSGRLRTLALQLIAQETGWTNLELIEPAAEDSSGVEVLYGDRNFGRLHGPGVDAVDLTPWAAWLASWLALGRQHEELREASYTDPLTGAWNRRYFESFLPEALNRARADRRPLTLVVFDVDDLKQYNDRFGHDAGDEVLRETVGLIRAMIRKGDRVCRIGGDEFVVIFADLEPARRAGSQPLDSIEQIVRRFQRGICELCFPRLGGKAPGPMSISAGMATFPWDGHDAQTLLRVADQLALESKRRGKNLLTIGRGGAECENA